MTKKICIMCEEKKEINSFSWSSGHGGNFCEDCWRNNKNDYLYKYDNKFNYDLFYLKNPEEKPADWGEIDIDVSLSKLESELKRGKKLLPVYQKRGTKTELEIQEMEKNITRLEKEITELKKFQTCQVYQEQK